MRAPWRSKKMSLYERERERDLCSKTYLGLRQRHAGREGEKGKDWDTERGWRERQRHTHTQRERERGREGEGAMVKPVIRV